MVCEADKYSLWDFPEAFAYRGAAARVDFEDAPSNLKAKKIIAQCETISAVFARVENPGNIVATIYAFFTERTVGHIDYVLFASRIGR